MRPAPEPATRRYRFEDLVLDPGQRRLWRGDEEIRLNKLSFDFLLALVEAAPNLLTADKLAEIVWGPRRVVSRENVSKRLMILRRSLGDQAEQPRYIEVVRAQGYRLIPNVQTASEKERASSVNGWRHRRLAVAFVPRKSKGLYYRFSDGRTVLGVERGAEDEISFRFLGEHGGQFAQLAIEFPDCDILASKLDHILGPSDHLPSRPNVHPQTIRWSGAEVSATVVYPSADKPCYMSIQSHTTFGRDPAEHGLE